jgi:hypothetical protein
MDIRDAYIRLVLRREGRAVSSQPSHFVSVLLLACGFTLYAPLDVLTKNEVCGALHAIFQHFESTFQICV